MLPSMEALTHVPNSCGCRDVDPQIYPCVHVCVHYGMHTMHIEINNILRTNISFEKSLSDNKLIIYHIISQTQTF